MLCFFLRLRSLRFDGQGKTEPPTLTRGVDLRPRPRPICHKIEYEWNWREADIKDQITWDCTDGNNLNSVCIKVCPEGYRLQKKNQDRLTCLPDTKKDSSVYGQNFQGKMSWCVEDRKGWSFHSFISFNGKHHKNKTSNTIMYFLVHFFTWFMKNSSLSMEWATVSLYWR